ncbi:PTS fructose transporter subunit IIA, partial [Listeria monocytogenes]
AVLQQLMGTIQDKDNVAALLRAKDEDEVKQILETIAV